ncbi:MAG: SAM-dependent methyltransferase [Desulfurococcales archaeon]|nr:SAM-dependent methyltransferase [Desulfurococcales archaeon]
MKPRNDIYEAKAEMRSIPQYKVNIHVASILSMLGLPARAEEPFYVKVARRTRKIPDFVLNHSIAGGVLGEAEIGSTEFDPEAATKLRQRAYERFDDIAFKGYDFIMLLIYPKKAVEEIARLPEFRIEKELMEKTVGLGIAIRKNPFNLTDHYIKWYNKPVKIIDIPHGLDLLISEFFKNMKKQDPYIKVSVYELVESINTLIENSSRTLSLVKDKDLVNRLAKVARKLSVAWDQIKKPEDKIEITTKFILLMSTLVILFHEIVRNERLLRLEPLECETLNAVKLANHFENLIEDKNNGTTRYAELNEGFIEVLKEVPQHPQINNAVISICNEIKHSYTLMRRLGWDILSMFYQRLLSETYRHAFATFYTKLPAARLLASLAIKSLDDEVIDPACGTGSLLLASVERRRMLLGGELLKKFYKKALEYEQPLLDIVNESILRNTAGLDALKPACFIAALNLRIATHGSPPNKLNIYDVSVGFNRAGSLDLLTSKKSVLPLDVKILGTRRYDVVIMNPPFTRSDRISFLMGKEARRTFLATQFYFGSTRVSNLFTAGMAKPFMVLADKLVKEGGRIAAVLPNSILNRPSWKDVRKELLSTYSLEYIVISWAPGTPNFSSDTRFREILLIARKKPAKTVSFQGSLNIVNLYKRIDDLGMDDIEIISKAASNSRKSVTHVVKGSEHIASIVSVELEKEIKKRLKKNDGKTISAEENDKEIEKLSGNLYRFIAFKNAELLKMHLDVIVKCSTDFKNIFKVGSVVDHTSGLSPPVKREDKTSYHHEIPALWGTGETLNIKAPWLKKAPYKIGVINEANVKVKYWKPRKAFYSARVFFPRKQRLSTQYTLMVFVNEDSVSNVWWPLKPVVEDHGIVMNYLVYMNSVFGFVHLLGERLETEGLYVEFKKNNLEDLPIPDLRNIRHPINDIIDTMKKPMPRFDKYIETMARYNEKAPWYKAAQEVIKEARKDNSLQPYANRATLDLKSFDMIRGVCQDTYIPDNLYKLLREDIGVLQQIMERHEDDEDIIEDIAKRVERKTKHVSLDKWIR